MVKFTGFGTKAVKNMVNYPQTLKVGQTLLADEYVVLFVLIKQRQLTNA